MLIPLAILLYPWPHSLRQLIKHGRLHPEVAEERLWVFYSELHHQSGVSCIQSPPLLRKPWTALMFSGSSHSLSFPSLLHISFKQILLEDSNLEQSNIVQRVHTLQRLTNENAKLGSILYPVGKYYGNIIDTCGTFMLHSKYFQSTC